MYSTWDVIFLVALWSTLILAITIHVYNGKLKRAEKHYLFTLDRLIVSLYLREVEHGPFPSSDPRKEKRVQ